MINIDHLPHPTITRAMIAAFDNFNDDDMPILDYTLSATSTIPMTADFNDDTLTLRLDLDDELQHLLLIAIYDRNELTLTSLILHADATTTIIPT
jgi:hypothetical protein